VEREGKGVWAPNLHDRLTPLATATENTRSPNSDLLVENRANFIPHLYLAPPQGVTPSEFREHLDIHKTGMNGLSCGEEGMTIYSAVLIGCQRVRDRRTDGRTDGRPAYIYYVLQHS